MLTKLEKEQKLRLFQQLHQDYNPLWYRASGNCICSLCGLEYRDHYNTVDFDGQLNVDHRLCNGNIVHL